MPRSHEALQGRTPEKAETALLLVDLINDLEFEEGGELLAAALPVGRAVAELKRRARRAGVPAIYVNDNFGKWRSDFSRLVRHCLEGGVRGRPLAELLLPEEDDYFVLKPGLSGFYSTTLDVLLRHLEARRVIVTGLAGNICVLFTATDAHMRGYRVAVPSDCVASNTPGDSAYALELMRRVLDADVRPSRQLDLGGAAPGTVRVERRADRRAAARRPRPRRARPGG